MFQDVCLRYLIAFSSIVLVAACTTSAATGSAAGGQAEAPVAAGEAVPDLPPEAFSGLYYGAIVYRPGGTEIEILVELGVDGDGEMAGTLDMLAYPDVTYKPLENFSIEGRQVYFSYRNFSEVRGPDALFELEAELTDDGERLEGGFLEQRGRIPFNLERLGDVGSPRPELEPRPLADLEGPADFKDRFNAHADQARLVILLSPT